MKSSRRSFLKTTALASAAVAGRSLYAPLRMSGKPASQTLRFPPRLESGVLRAAETTVQMFEGAQTEIYGLNGIYLGPTIEIDRGDEFEVRMENRLPEQELVLHWHGVLAPSNMDGHPHMAVPSGENIDYRYTVDQRAGTNWYHPHTDPLTGPQVYRGMAGLYIIHDEEERGLPLPTGKYDVPLVLQDKRVSEQNELIYELNGQEIMRGWQGDTMLVNGTPDARFTVERTRYRFRLLNGSNARVFMVGFGDDRTFHLIANDGALLPAPVEVDSFYLSPGGRAEILVDFSDDMSGETLALETKSFEEEFFPGSRQGVAAELMRFEIGADGPAPPALPTTLASFEPHDPEKALRSRRFQLHMTDGKHSINDLHFEKSRIDFNVPENELEIWEFFNGTQIIHPMHVHGVQFQVLDRNGSVENLRPEDTGWTDMALVFPTSSVRVLVRFTAHTGMFMVHCHNLEHEDDGMMLNFMVDGFGSVRSGSDAAANLRAEPNVSDGLFTCRFKPSRSVRKIHVSDPSGRTLLNDMVPPGVDHYRLDLRSNPTGQYIVLLGTEMIRVVVKG